MDLLEVRKNFILRCGRYDLVNEDWTDNGANFFIQAGQRFLDRRANLDTPYETVVIDYMKVQESFLEIPHFWLIRKVEWLGDSAYGWRELTRRVGRGALRYAMAKRGDPVAYRVAVKRFDPRLKHRGVNEILSPADAFPDVDPNSSSMTIEILPSPRENGSIKIEGKLFSDPLIEDTDKNFWTVNNPDILIKSALYELEIFYRNSEGAKDWLSSIQLDLTDMEQLEVQQDIEGKDQIRG